jgi:hypothetical protein
MRGFANAGVDWRIDRSIWFDEMDVGLRFVKAANETTKHQQGPHCPIDTTVAAWPIP